MIKDAALEYLALGWVPIPVGPNKRPLITWKQYQTDRPDEKDVARWWKEFPEANVGLVTGKVSGLTVIDIDTDAGKSAFARLITPDFKSPIVHTPKGGKHIYCQYHPFGNNCKAIEGIDLRSEGGYVVAPPSRAASGGWTWDKDSGLNTPLPSLPTGYIDAVIENVIIPGDRSYKIQPGRTFSPGQRNNDLYHVCLKWGKGGMPEDEMLEYALWIGRTAGLSRYEVERTMVSALKMATRAERNLSQELKDWIRVTDGEFSVTDCVKSLDIVTKSDRANIRQALHRFKKDGFIEKSGRKDGLYRRIDDVVTEIDWKNAPDREYDIKLPLGLNKLVEVYPKQIIVLAGFKEAGKTAICLEVARLNMGQKNVLYASSEMGDVELRKRLSRREDTRMEHWNCKFIERTHNFEDCICPEGLNIIDYLEVPDGEYWRVSIQLTRIFKRLTSGVAFVALQKPQNRDTGEGGEKSLQKPRLYLALNRLDHNTSKIKIVSLKIPRTTESYVGKEKVFRIVGGWKFLEDSDWHWPKK